MKKLYLSFGIALAILAVAIIEAGAQTNPAPQTIPYSQNFSALPHASTAYPSGWQGWSIPTGTATTFNTSAPLGDLSLQASSNAANAVEGAHNYNGAIGMLAAGTTTTFTTNVALCLSLVTTGVNNILVTYSVNTIRNPYNVSTNNRINQCELQYRVGTTGNFISIGGVSLYQNNTTTQTGAVTTPQNQQTRSVTLPAACNNQTVVQLRWVQRDMTGTVGTLRPSFGIDNVSICPTSATPSVTITGPSALCAGTNPTFVATATNGGTTPAYQWKRNGTNVGTNSPSVSPGGLVPGDQISCVLTSNQTCITSTTATSNVITIASTNSPPSITSAVVTNASCGSTNNGAINITVSGGTPPYTIAWDTINKANGPLFGVITGTKTAAHPFPPPLGIGLSYFVDGIDGKELKLVKGIQYSFSLATSGHPWHISTDSVGANSSGFVFDGQTGSSSGSSTGTVTFRPKSTHPTTLYYPCAAHQWMGGRVRIQNGYLIEDPVNLSPGIYSVSVTDMNGCVTTAQYTVGQGGGAPVSLSAAVADAACDGTGGAINLSVGGGTGPFTVCWDTTNIDNGGMFSVVVASKTAAHPAFGMGSALGYVVDGTEGKELTLTKGINYTFNVMTPNHPFFITSSSTGGSTAGEISPGQTGAHTQNGVVTYRPSNTHPSLVYYQCSFHPNMGWEINNVSGYCIEDLTNIQPGTYSVYVTDVNGCSATAQYTVNQGTSSPISLSAAITDADCDGSGGGAIDLMVSGGSGPYTICWDTVNIDNAGMFSVSFAAKTAAHPAFGMGSSFGYLVDGVEGKELTLTRGVPYTFNVMTSNHPFFITSSATGGSTAGEISPGQTGAHTQVGTVTYTPDLTHPALVYYQCSFHPNMGWEINNTSGYCIEDLSNLQAGVYSVTVTDSDGCTATGQFTVNTSNSTISLSATTTDANCINNGSIDLSISGGVGPYTACWDTMNTGAGPMFGVMEGPKTPDHPYFNLGAAASYYIDGVEAKELKLVRGITYQFDIMSPGHPWHVSTDSVGANASNIVSNGQTGAPTDFGMVTFTPDLTHPALLRYVCAFHDYMGYNISISNGYCVEDPSGLGPGFHTVHVTDANGCTATGTFSVGQNAYTINGTLTSTTDATCFGYADGTADLNPSGGTPPYSVTGTGPVFTVISQVKNHSHPVFGTGSANGYTIDGVQGKELTLIRGITYSFSVMAPGHPFFISSSSVGGPANLASEITQGVTGSMVQNGVLTFTPDASHPNLLYYQCGFHNNMGWKLNIVDQLPNGDLGNCMAGSYSLFLLDANGCPSSSSLDFTISEPSANLFFYDGDSDTYGKNSETALSCLAPPGFSALGDDCDDTNPAVNPGATEICNGIDDNCDGTIDEGCGGISLDIKVILQGYYLGSGQMQPVLLNQSVAGASGSETDTVYAELRSSADPTIVEASATAVINTSGMGTCSFTTASTGIPYWLVIKHRNSIQTWSANTIVLNATSNSYDFSIASSQAYSNNMIDALSDGTWSFYSGDINQDEFIDIFDFPIFDIDNQNFVSGVYVASDMNGDGFVDIFDFPDFDTNNQMFIMSMHP